MLKYHYPFEDFLADFDALTATNPVGDTPSHSFFRSTLNYFRATYVRRRVRRYCLIRFMLAVTYLAEHFPEFDVDDFAVFGSDRAGGLVSEPLLRAVHQVFAAPTVFALAASPTPAEMLSLARGLRDADPPIGQRPRSHGIRLKRPQ